MPSQPADRLWRARKHHAWMDAQLRPSSDGAFELRIYYDGEPILTRKWPAREGALDQASHILKDMQRAGWNTHW
ncbi:MAG TPA: hypothetical protein VH583_11720 [Vicinamibacterales bacterium]|jgi:hypothetical protein